MAIRAILLMLLCVPALHAGPVRAAVPGVEAAPLPGITSMELEEVEVIGKKLHQMQRETVEAEDRFYALYNQLNRNRDFDIHCVVEAKTGTQLRKRECRIGFIERVSEMHAKQFLYSLTSASPGPPVPLQTAEVEWLARRDEYRENARALLLANPELLARALEWRRLQAQYDRARKQRMKGRLILIE